MSGNSRDGQATDRGEKAGRRRFAGMLVTDVALPLALYHLLRGLGASPRTALLAGADIPLCLLAWHALRPHLKEEA